MTVEAILGVVSFVGLFTAWVILPSHIRKRHASKSEDDQLSEE